MRDDPWSPISSAPLDGTEILLCDPSTSTIMVGFWDEEQSLKLCTRFGWTAGDDVFHHVNAFSHWMPLPPWPRSTPDAP